MGTHPIFESDFDCLTEKMPAQSTVDPVKEELNQLIKKKDITEQLIQVYREQAILDEDLILPDGFPRNDIDLVAVRTARNKHACLRNDHIALMRQIEQKMGEFYRAKNDSRAGTKFTGVSGAPTTPAFVKVDHVKPLSPAYLAGLQPNDQLHQLGSIDATNFESLPQLAQMLKQHENSPVCVWIRRNEQTIEQLELTPRTWSGSGLLGATLTKI